MLPTRLAGSETNDITESSRLAMPGHTKRSSLWAYDSSTPIKEPCYPDPGILGTRVSADWTATHLENPTGTRRCHPLAGMHESPAGRTARLDSVARRPGARHHEPKAATRRPSMRYRATFLWQRVFMASEPRAAFALATAALQVAVSLPQTAERRVPERVVASVRALCPRRAIAGGSAGEW